LDSRWSYALEHLFHLSPQQFAVRGVGTRMGASWAAEYWHALIPGSDVITEVPMSRWDHAMYYDDDPECWKRLQVNVKHVSLIDGLELFDAKFFRLSPAETRGMDPMQRQILEVGYHSLCHAGCTTKTLLQSLTAVYVGCPTSEWTLVDQGVSEAGGCEQRSAGTGFAGSIMSNRFSFVFGMNGPSVTFDTDASSSLVILEVNATMACCVAANVVLTPLTWLNRVGLGHMSPAGRCFTFDQSSSGFVKGEGVTGIALDRLTETIEGVLVQDESRPLVGTIGSVAVSHMGQAASLGTPHGPSVQRVIAEACREARVDGLSIDAVECMGDGQALNDAVEVTSLCKALTSETWRIPLQLGSVKSNVGNSIQASGMAQILKVLFSQSFGLQPPSLHLRQLLPQAEAVLESPAVFGNEVLAFHTRTSLVGITSFGWGGTICHAVCSGGLDLVASTEPLPRQQLVFWPGGGGQESL
ncbi:unnamed protein product, partial [Polarella glacialis]